MKRILISLVIPIAVAAWSFWAIVRSDGNLSANTLSAGVFGLFFYSAPHCVWAAVAALSRASSAVTNSGFIAANLVLVGIATYPLYGRTDPSGLPYEWVAYWPFALGLQLLTVIVVAAANGNWRNETAAG